MPLKAKLVLSRKKVFYQYDKIKGYCDYVSYSSKTNPIVTGILEKEKRECMFSIHLKNELKNVKDKKRVIFLVQGWTEEDVEELVGMGVRWFVVDNKPDLEVLEKFFEGYDAVNGKLNLMLRLRLKENTLKTERYFVFGFMSGELNREIRRIRKRWNGKLGKLGVHFHRKTQNMAEWNLTSEFEENVDGDVTKLIDVVCIGGGLPAEYANTNVDVINSIFEKIRKFRIYLNDKGIGMIIEPGRFMAASAGKLVCRIVRVYSNNIVVNASVYNSDLDALIVPVKLKVEGELDKDDLKGVPYVIKGCTPCSMDLFRYRVYLNSERVREFEEIVFLNAGAYNFGSDFCDLERLEIEIVE